MTEQLRQPVGIPVGGQFAAVAQAEPDVNLAPGPQPLQRPAETQRRRRGHNFYPPARDMGRWPGLYATEEIPAAEKPIMAHYFQGPMDWYIAEYNPQDNEAFGYADLGHGHGEWGYIQLDDIEQLRGQFGLPIERDLDFTPGTPAKDCIARYRDAPAQPTAEEPAAEDAEDDRNPGWDGPDEANTLSPEDRRQWDEHHRFAYDYGYSVLGVTGFETRDTVEEFAGFAANAYMESGWNGMMDIHGVVDDWMAHKHPNGPVAAADLQESQGCDHDGRCCTVHGTHATPRRGCILC